MLGTQNGHEPPDFGSRLKALRQARGLTQTELGKGLVASGGDVSKQSIHDWEKSDHSPKVDQIIALCQRLQCSADYLLFGQKDPLPEVIELCRAFEKLGDDKSRRRQVAALCLGMVEFATRDSPPTPGREQPEPDSV